MEKAVGVLGTPGHVPASVFMSTDAALKAVGDNTGNLVFQYAVAKSIAEQKIFVGSDIPWDPAKVRERCRVLVVPSANFLRENFDFTGFVGFLEATKLPLVFLGLGAQADSFEKKEFNFHPSILRLMGLLRERCRTVGVRGAYTAELLERHGVQNVSVIGCPSNFLNPDPELPQKLEAKWISDTVSVATTGDEPWPKNPLKVQAERKLIELSLAYLGIYVQQSVKPLVQLIRARNPYQNAELGKDTPASLRRAIAPQLSEREFAKFVASSVRLYFNVDQWLEDLSRFDLSIGLRLHGNMVPFQAGCPSIWVYHDARTKELVDTMCLPSLSVEQFLKLNSIEAMKAACEADFKRYATNRAMLLQRYREILAAHDIKH